MEEMESPFEFRQCISILRSTGKKAANLKELREIIATVSDDSVFHHTYQYFLKEHILEYTNDFAHWAGESLEERALAEQLSNIDPYTCETISDLRAAIVSVIDSYLEVFPEPRETLPGPALPRSRPPGQTSSRWHPPNRSRPPIGRYDLRGIPSWPTGKTAPR